MITKPKIEAVPLADGLRWRGGGWLYQEKSDGVWCPLGWAGHLLNAERMAGGDHVVNDLVTLAGADVTGWGTGARWAALAELSRSFPAHMRLCRIGNGGEFLEAVLAEGGEGVVAKPAEAPFGVGWFKAKRMETFDCMVVEAHPVRQSIRLDFEGGDAGWCAALGARGAQIVPGMVVEVAAYGRHPSGKFREPRLVRLRPDKQNF